MWQKFHKKIIYSLPSRYWGILGLISLLGLLILSLLTVFFFINASWPHQRPSYIITEISEGLEELWVSSGFFTSPNSSCPLIVASDGVLFLSGGFSWPPSNVVYAFDGSNGQILWRQNNVDSHSFSCFSATPEALFVGSNGSGRITAYNPIKGTVLWTKKLPGARSVGSFYVMDNIMDISPRPSGRVRYFVNAKTGEILWNFPSPFTLNTMQEAAAQLGITQTHQIQLKPWPVVRNGVSINHDGYGLHAHNPKTNELLWEWSGINSNILVTRENVYLLTSANELVILSLKTGSIIDFVKFEPTANNAFESSSLDADTNKVAVDESAHRLYVTFGDSAQIFAFRIGYE